MRLAHLGKKPSEEAREKMSLSKIGNKNNNGKKRAKPMSEETKKKIGAANYAAHRRKNLIKSLDEI